MVKKQARQSFLSMEVVVWFTETRSGSSARTHLLVSVSGAERRPLHKSVCETQTRNIWQTIDSILIPWLIFRRDASVFRTAAVTGEAMEQNTVAQRVM